MNPYLRRASPDWSEFEVQAVAYVQLVKWLGPHRVRGEYPIRHDTTYQGKRGAILRRQHLRLDLVILAADGGGGRLLVLEIKRTATATGQKAARRQRSLYPQAAGCPVLLLGGMADACRVVELVGAALPGFVPAAPSPRR